MGRGPSYRVPFRRRNKGKTNYQLRRALVRSKLHRLVVRNTIKHIIIQVLEAKTYGDETIVSAHSSELTKTYDWQGACRNVPAAYLTGLLCGYRLITKGIKKAVLDIGLQSPSKGARIFAALKGVLDAGVTVPHSDTVLPDEYRLSGQHIVDYASQLSSDSEKYQKTFSKYLSRGLPPEQVSDHFSFIKEKIISSFKEEGT